jgi:hypothetical protein
MFCYLEQIELKVTACPVKCIYRDKAKSCGYRSLTPDVDQKENTIQVTTQKISSVKGVKLYSVKAEAARAKAAIKTGLLILGYTEFIKSQKVVQVSDEIRDFTQRTKDTKDSDEPEYEKVEAILLSVFGLGFEHRQMFYDPKTFKTWRQKADVQVKLSEFIDAILAIAWPKPPSTKLSEQTLETKDESKDLGKKDDSSSVHS